MDSLTTAVTFDLQELEIISLAVSCARHDLRLRNGLDEPTPLLDGIGKKISEAKKGIQKDIDFEEEQARPRFEQRVTIADYDGDL